MVIIFTSCRFAGAVSRVVALGAPVLLAAVVLSGCIAGDGAEAHLPDERAVPRVRFAAVKEGAAEPAILASGRLVASSEAALSFRSGGTLRSIAVRPGERVRQGQALATLDSAELSASLRKARDVWEQSRRDQARGENLFAREIISRKDLEDLQTAAAVADSELRSASYRAQLALVAPYDGIVQQRLVEPGENVAAGAPVLVLGKHASGRGDFVFRAAVAEKEVMRVHVGDAAQITIESLRDRKFGGRVRQVGAAADSQSGRYDVEIDLAEPAPGMAAGMIGVAELARASGVAATRSYVPLSAIVEGTQRKARLFLLAGDTAREQVVSIAFLHGDLVALNEPLPADGRVITDGAELLSDGQRVTPVE
jgi:RND family efflux transporter MFP subunit